MTQEVRQMSSPDMPQDILRLIKFMNKLEQNPLTIIVIKDLYRILVEIGNILLRMNEMFPLVIIHRITIVT